MAPTTGHVVPELARGFSGVGRWLQLAAAAIEDLCTSAAPARTTVLAPGEASVALLLEEPRTAQTHDPQPQARARGRLPLRAFLMQRYFLAPPADAPAQADFRPTKRGA